jgi:hypothetical protein
MRTRLQAFLDVAIHLGADEGLRDRYAARLDERRTALVWLIEVQQQLSVEALAKELGTLGGRALPLRSGDEPLWIYSTAEADRLRLGALDDTGHLLQHVPSLSPHHDPSTLQPGERLLFALMGLPRVVSEELLRVEPERRVDVSWDELSEFVDAESFGRLFGVAFSAWAKETGRTHHPLRVQPFTTVRPIEYRTLRSLFDDAVAPAVPENAAYFGGPHGLDAGLLARLPRAARALLSLTTQPSFDEHGRWPAGQAGAFVYTILAPGDEEVFAARHRGEAHRHAAALVSILRSDEAPQVKRARLTDALHRHYRDIAHAAPAFGLLLEELDRLGALDELLAALDRIGGELAHLVVRLWLRLAPRLQQRMGAQLEIVRRHLEQFRARHRTLEYRTGDEAAIRLRSGDWIGKDRAFAEVSSTWRSDKEGARLTEPKRTQLHKAVLDELVKIFGEVAGATDRRTYQEQDLYQTALDRATKRVAVGDAVERFVLQRSIMLVDVDHTVEAGLEKYWVTYDFVEREYDGRWESIPGVAVNPFLPGGLRLVDRHIPWRVVPGGRRTRQDADEFEEFLIEWGLQETARIVEVFAAGVSLLAVGVLAVELGAVAALVSLAGGTKALLTSIVISELIYLIHAAYYDQPITLHGILLAALNGFLGAVGFRVAAFVGRLAGARLLGEVETATLGWLISGVAVEVVVRAVVGGGASAALITFTDGLVEVLLGRGEWPTLDEYLRNITYGVAIGIVVELLVGTVSVARGTVAKLRAVRAAAETRGGEPEWPDISRAEWDSAVEEALQRWELANRELLDDVTRTRVQAGLRARLRELGQALAAETRAQLLTRALGLVDVPLSSTAARGLERLGAALLPSDPILLAIVRRFGRPDQAAAFFETLGRLEPAMLARIVSTHQLEAFADSPLLAAVVHERGGEAAWALLRQSFGGRVADVEEFLVELTRLGEQARTRGLRALQKTAGQVPPRGVLLALAVAPKLTDVEIDGLAALYRQPGGAPAAEQLLSAGDPSVVRLLLGGEGLRARRGSIFEEFTPGAFDALAELLPEIKVDAENPAAAVRPLLARELDIPESELSVEPIGSGKSGATAFWVKRGGKAISVFKIFRSKQEMIDELSALRRSRAIGSDIVGGRPGVPVRVELEKTETGGTKTTTATGGMLLELAGKTVRHQLRELRALEPGPARQAAFEELEQSMERVARAQAELHSSSSGGFVSRQFKAAEVGWLEDKIRKIESTGRLTNAQLKALRDAIKPLSAEFLTADIDAAIVHGDAHLENFTVNARGQVVVIDTETLFRSVSPEGRGVAPAGTDAGRFVESIQLDGKESRTVADVSGAQRPLPLLSDNEIALLQRRFLDSYVQAARGQRGVDVAVRFYQVNYELIQLRGAALSGLDTAPALARIHLLLEAP